MAQRALTFHTQFEDVLLATATPLQAAQHMLDVKLVLTDLLRMWNIVYSQNLGVSESI